MLHIVPYSMGVCSGYIACTLQDQGLKPICPWSDTKREDEDTYRFGHEVARRWKLNVIEASDGRDLWDVFRQQHIIPARQIAMCSIKMKIVPFQKFMETLTEPGIVYYGYEPDEEDRAEKLRAEWPYPNMLLAFPLIEGGIKKQQCAGYFHRHNVKTPSIYEHFQHANCLPCKNFRLPDWIALGYWYPEKFMEAMLFEEETGLRWMQDGPTLREVLSMIPAKPPGRKGRHKLKVMEPAFDFTMGCDRCAMD